VLTAKPDVTFVQSRSPTPLSSVVRRFWSWSLFERGEVAREAGWGRRNRYEVTGGSIRNTPNIRRAMKAGLVGSGIQGADYFIT